MLLRCQGAIVVAPASRWFELVRHGQFAAAGRVPPVNNWGQTGKRLGATRPCACRAHATRGRSPGAPAGWPRSDNRTATCGYNCQDYSDAIALQKEEWISLCQLGKETTRMLRTLH